MILVVLLLSGAVGGLEELYFNGEYEQVVAATPAVIAESARSREDSILVYRYAAFAAVALGREAEARQWFQNLLALEPGHELDPEQVSPKIRAVFGTARVEQPARLLPDPVSIDTVYLRRPVPWTVIIPGAAQIRQERRGIGYSLLGFGVASVGGFAVSAFGYNQARRAYLDATEPAEINDAWNTANNWYRVRTVCAAGMATVWLGSLLDALHNL